MAGAHRRALDPAAVPAAADRARPRTCRGWSTCGSAGSRSAPGRGAEAPTWSRAHHQSPYDGSAGFLNKWEHHFVRWAEGEGLALDYLTDHDLDAEPGALDPYAVVILVGHSEYWSGASARRASTPSSTRGGRLAIFSGNTCFWKVRWEDGGSTAHLPQVEGLRGDRGRRRPAAGDPPLVAPGVRAAGGARSPASASSSAAITGSGSCVARGHRRLHRLPRPALGAGRLRPLLRRRDRRRDPADRLRERRLPAGLRRRRPAARRRPPRRAGRPRDHRRSPPPPSAKPWAAPTAP